MKNSNLLANCYPFILISLSVVFGVNSTNTSKSVNVHTVNLNMNTNLTNFQPRPNENKVKTLAVLVFFSAIAALSVLINMRVFYIVFILSKRKTRPANILVAHLSSVVIEFTCIMYAYMLGKANVVSLTGTGICNLLSFLLNGVYNVFSLNVGAIIWVRTKSDAINLRKSFVYRSIGLMWASTIVGNLPSFFTVEPDIQRNKCREVPLLGSDVLTTVYEMMGLLFFNVLVCMYLVRSSIKMNFSIRYLEMFKLTQSEKIRKRIQKVRFVHLQTIVFVLSWFPSGLCRFFYQLISRLGWTRDIFTFLSVFVFLSNTVFILCPLSFVFLLEEMSIQSFAMPCFLKRNTHRFLEPSRKNEQEKRIVGRATKPKSHLSPIEKSASLSSKSKLKMEELKETMELEEMSRISTVDATDTSENIRVPLRQINPAHNSICSENSSIPPLPTSSASLQLQTVMVELHGEPIKTSPCITIIFSKQNSEHLI